MNEEQIDRGERMVAPWRRERPDVDPSPWYITFRIHVLEKLLQASHARVAISLGVTQGGLDLMLVLRRSANYELSPTDLSQTLLISPAAVSNRIDVLEHAGLVRREIDPMDRRSVHVILTPDGWEKTQVAIEALLKNRHAELEVLTEEEREALAGLLRKLLLSLDREDGFE